MGALNVSKRLAMMLGRKDSLLAANQAVVHHGRVATWLARLAKLFEQSWWSKSFWMGIYFVDTLVSKTPRENK
jgi:hypothetical protein